MGKGGKHSENTSSMDSSNSHLIPINSVLYAMGTGQNAASGGNGSVSPGSLSHRILCGKQKHVLINLDAALPDLCLGGIRRIRPEELEIHSRIGAGSYGDVFRGSILMEKKKSSKKDKKSDDMTKLKRKTVALKHFPIRRERYGSIVGTGSSIKVNIEENDELRGMEALENKIEKLSGFISELGPGGAYNKLREEAFALNS